MADNFWLDKARAGDAWAQYWLAMDYYDGKNGVKKDMSEAIYWLEKSANQGNSPACYAIGMIYYLGEYVFTDYAKAKRYLLQSASVNDEYVQKAIRDCDEHLNN